MQLDISYNIVSVYVIMYCLVLPLHH